MDAKERPISFKTEEIRAILEGRKSVTRRVIKSRSKKVIDPIHA